MKYLKTSIKTKYEVEDIVANVIQNVGICGVEINDNKNLTDDELKNMFVDIPLIKNNNDEAIVSFYIKIVDKNYIKKYIDKNVDNSYIPSDDNYFTENEYIEKINIINLELKKLNEFLDMGELTIKTEEIDDIDYLNNWKQFFKTIIIDDIVIKPIWDKNKYNGIEIKIDPGSAFGTGQHETTKLCIKNIKKFINSDYENLLDIGCGSGILGITAIKLGINKTVNIDVDKNIIYNINNNLECNNINKNNFEIYFGNILNDKMFYNKIKKYKYDIIVANILSPVIINLIEINIHELLSKKGILIFSGILKNNENDVIKHLKNKNLNILNIEYENEWVSIVSNKI